MAVLAGRRARKTFDKWYACRRTQAYLTAPDGAMCGDEIIRGGIKRRHERAGDISVDLERLTTAMTAADGLGAAPAYDV